MGSNSQKPTIFLGIKAASPAEKAFISNAYVFLVAGCN